MAVFLFATMFFVFTITQYKYMYFSKKVLLSAHFPKRFTVATSPQPWDDILTYPISTLVATAAACVRKVG